MGNNIKVFGTSQAAAQIGLSIKALQVWLQNHPDYRPATRINTDDMLWTQEDIERVKAERAKPGKGRRRPAK